MNDEEKLLTSLYDNIRDYSEVSELLENLIKIFESLFGREESEGDILKGIQHIVEHKTYEFYDFKEKFLELFHNALISMEKTKEYHIDLCKDEFFHISHSIKTILEDTLFLYQHEFLLEITSFINAKEGSFELKEDLKNLTKENFTDNLQGYYKEIDYCAEKVQLLVEDKVYDYEGFLWSIKKFLLDTTKNKTNLGEKLYVDNLLKKRETFINTTDVIKDEFSEDIIFIVASSFIRNIRNTLLVAMDKKLLNYKESLNKYLELQKSYEHKEKSIKVNYKSILPDKIELEVYNICRELFISQYNYLQRMFNFCNTKFETLTSEVKYKLDTIFNNEFQLPIYFINCEEDFLMICDILDEKLQFILYTFIINAFNDFKSDYYDYIMEKLWNKKQHLENMYCEKLILNSIKYVNSFSDSTKFKLYDKLEELYKGYDSEEILQGNCAPMMLNFYNIEDDIPKLFFKDFIYNDIDYQNLFSKEKFHKYCTLEEKKNALYKEISAFRKKLWDKLYNELILYFDYILPNIGRHMDYAKKQADYYKNKTEETIL
ncbi:hypothetical protein [Clostridium sp.]|uniref:hypothetical protein n=1 Tax=Clostridium sp. TaxID=1506 RepID=UPI002FC808DB